MGWTRMGYGKDRSWTKMGWDKKELDKNGQLQSEVSPRLMDALEKMAQYSLR